MSELTPNLKLFKYNTETDAKQPFSINDCMNANWDKLDASLGSLEICDIGMSLYVDESKGKRRYLNGQIVARNANTEAFFKRLQEITTLYPSLLCTEEEWQTAKTMSAFGQVGKFVFNYADSDITSVRIPAIVNVQGLFDLQNLGLTVEAGLPNITGTLGRDTGSGTTPTQEGALYADDWKYENMGGYGNGEGDSRFTIKLDASKSNPIYNNSTTVQQEAIQYPYFIQIATGSETENHIVNDIELNNPYSLFECKYADHELFNLSWLKSNGQWNTKAVYSTAYEALQVEYNSEIQAGTTSTLPSAVSYTKQGLSVKLSTEEYTDYDFVLNTTDETFRLPIQPTLLNNTRYLLEKGEQNGISYRVYSDGYCEQWGVITGANDAVVTTSFLKQYSSIPIVMVNFTHTNRGTANYVYIQARNVTNTSFTITTFNDNTPQGTLWRACGYLAEGGYISLTNSTLLYYYVGETVQNANLIDAGKLEEQLGNKVDLNAQNLSVAGKSLISALGMPSNKSVDLTLGATGTTYTAPENGYVNIRVKSTSNYNEIIIDTPSMMSHDYVNVANAYMLCFVPVKKGDKFIVGYYNITSDEHTFFRFIYAEGEV